MKTKRIRQGGVLFAVLLGSLFLMSMTISSVLDWEVPAKYQNMKNPYVGKADADGIGKDLFSTHCASCHGKEGFGDGKKAENLESEMRDFTSEEVQGQTDGALYYKTFIGRDEMPNFEKKIKAAEDRWMLINYLRKLAE